MRSNAKLSDKKRKKDRSSIGPPIETPESPRRSSTGGAGTMTPVLSESQLQGVMAKCQPFILRLVPKALKAFDQALSSGNPRLQLAAAVKLFEGIGLLGSRGNDKFYETAAALDQRENEKSLITAGLFMNTCMEKAELYNLPLPEDLAWLAPQIRALQQQILDKKKAGELSSRDPAEIPPLRSHSGRDQSKGEVRGYGRIIQKESTEP